MLGRYPTCNPINKYAPGPMPPIQDSSPMANFECIDINLIREWEIRPGRKVIAVPFDLDVTVLELHKAIRSKILTAVDTLSQC
jgi:hypothetical protein